MQEPPHFMESFIKAYGFKTIVEDLKNTSKLLRNPTITRYLVISQIDGGFPFVFWWNYFLSNQPPSSRFSAGQTPIYGITKGDEYYPVTGMAGNIATITNSLHGMLYPHNIKEIDRMPQEEVNEFYSACCALRNVPKFHKRVLFFGKIDPELQYSIPYLLHSRNSEHPIYEPFRIGYVPKGTLESFYKTFGYSRWDVVVEGELELETDKRIRQEFENRGMEIKDIDSFIEPFGELLEDINEAAKISNLNQNQITKVINRTKNTLENAKKFHKSRS